MCCGLLVILLNIGIAYMVIKKLSKSVLEGLFAFTLIFVIITFGISLHLKTPLSLKIVDYLKKEFLSCYVVILASLIFWVPISIFCLLRNMKGLRDSAKPVFTGDFLRNCLLVFISIILTVAFYAIIEKFKNIGLP